MMIMTNDDDADENISMTLLPSGLADGSHAGLSQWSSLISPEKRCCHYSHFFFNDDFNIFQKKFQGSSLKSPEKRCCHYSHFFFNADFNIFLKNSQWSSLISHEKRCCHYSHFFFNADFNIFQKISMVNTYIP